MSTNFWDDLHKKMEECRQKYPLTPQEAYSVQAEPMFNPQDLVGSYKFFTLKNEAMRRSGKEPDESAEAFYRFLYKQKKSETK